MYTCTFTSVYFSFFLACAFTVHMFSWYGNNTFFPAYFTYIAIYPEKLKLFEKVFEIFSNVCKYFCIEKYLSLYLKPSKVFVFKYISVYMTLHLVVWYVSGLHSRSLWRIPWCTAVHGLRGTEEDVQRFQRTSAQRKVCEYNCHDIRDDGCQLLLIICYRQKYDQLLQDNYLFFKHITG